MAGGLVGLLDDVAALAKLAAASVDDIGAAAGRAGTKAAGVVVDDAAVTPQYVQGLAANREIPIIRKIAVGSLRNKLLFIVPAVLILSEISEHIIEALLLAGGTFLAYEGAHKVIHALKHDDHDHDLPAPMKGPEAEKETVSGAIRTDFILSGEIMVISLKEVLEEPFALRAATMLVVAVLITVLIYGVVALIVKMDDVGLRLAQEEATEGLGRGLVKAMPVVLKVLSVVGTAAMFWVGGHILLVGADHFGWHWPYDQVHHLEEAVADVGGIGGFLAWSVNTLASAVIGVIVGVIVVQIVERLPFGPGASHDAETAAAH